MIADRVHRIRANLLTLLGGTSVAAGLTFATTAINARALGAEGLGIIVLTQAFVAFVTGILAVGTQQPIIRIGRAALLLNQTDKIYQVVYICVTLDVILAFIAGGVCVFSISAFTDPPDEYAQYVDAYAYTAFLSGVAAANGVFRVFDRFMYISIVQVIFALSNLAGSAVLLMVNAKLQAYLTMYVITQSSTYCLQATLGFVILRKNIAPPPARSLLRDIRPVLQEVLTYAWTTFGTATINAVRLRADVLVLSVFSGAAVVGVYGAMRQIAGVLNKATQATASATFSEISELAASGDTGSARLLLTKLSIVGVSFGALVFVAAILIGRPAIHVMFGDTFMAGYAALVLLSLSGAMMLSAATFGGFVQAFISPKTLLKIYVAACVIYILACASVFLGLGMTGGALAHVAFAATVWLTSWTILRRRLAVGDKQR